MKEKLSALFDGDVDEDTARTLFSRLKGDASFRAQWDAYCLLGDVIRSGLQPDTEGFVSRVMNRLEDEPTVLAPHRKPDAARQSSWRDHLVAIAASVMGVLAVGGVVGSFYVGWDAGMQPTVAAVSPTAVSPTAVSPTVVSSAVSSVVSPVGDAQMVRATKSRAARADSYASYIAAHNVMTGGPMPGAGHIRTVSQHSEK